MANRSLLLGLSRPREGLVGKDPVDGFGNEEGMTLPEDRDAANQARLITHDGCGSKAQ